MAQGRLLFETLHGSYLYGTNNENSDLDVYRVYDGRFKPTQTIIDGVDCLSLSLGAFVKQANKGVPQALEAMFAPDPSVDLISEFRSNYRAGLNNTTRTYMRTIRAFGRLDFTTKRGSHMIRLAYELSDIWGHGFDDEFEYGRFNPVLTDERKNTISNWVEDSRSFNDLIDIVDSISPVEVF